VNPDFAKVRFMAVVILLLFFLDATITLYGLRMGLAEELNPIVHLPIRVFGVDTAILSLTLLGGLMIVSLYKNYAKTRNLNKIIVFGFYILIATKLFAVVSNSRVFLEVI